jgi:endonuclease I
MPICPFAKWDPINGPVNSYTGEPFRIVHHVTDGSTYAGARSAYVQNRSEPHFTVDAGTIYQHIDTGLAARSLKNAPGGVQTNRANAVQIEVVGFSGKPKKEATLRHVERLCRWIERTHGIPREWPNGKPLPPRNGRDPGGHNRNAQTWRARGGHYGHCHVPENDHWDPGYTEAELRIVMGQAPVEGLADAAAVHPVEATAVDAATDAVLAAAFRELERFDREPYYDKDTDGAARDEYYRGIDWDAPADALYTALAELLDRTHRPIGYSPGRELHPWVDRHPDGSLVSIYTGDVYDAPTVVREAVRLEAEFDAWQQGVLAEAVEADPGRRSELVALLRAAPNFDCEHVVPQAWFRPEAEYATARGDLHHLFTCERPCNSYRGSVPFWEFPDWAGTGCGKREPGRFEPAQGKGAAARAVLYFLLRYPGRIDDAAGELQADRIGILLDWHEQDPPGLYERHRNATIFARQGNRNPLIDFPERARAIPFERGLGR